MDKANKLTRQYLLKMSADLENLIDESFAEYLKETGKYITKAEFIRTILQTQCDVKPDYQISVKGDVMKTFRDQYLDLQYLVRDMLSLRAYNDQQARNGTLNNCMLFAEATTLCVAFERFLRVLPVINAKKGETLSNFIERALSTNKPIFKNPFPNIPNARIIKVIRDIRNGILHGDFESLATEYKHAGVSNTDQYFKGGHFTQDLQIVFETFNSMIKEINALTGQLIVPMGRIKGSLPRTGDEEFGREVEFNFGGVIYTGKFVVSGHKANQYVGDPDKIHSQDAADAFYLASPGKFSDIEKMFISNQDSKNSEIKFTPGQGMNEISGHMYYTVFPRFCFISK